MAVKKPIAVIITDTHLDDNNHEENVSVYKQAIALANELRLNRVEHAGDLFHSRKAQTQRNLNCLGRIFAMFEEEEITLNVVVGNHDKTEYSSQDSFLDSYKHHPYINIISTWQCRDIESAQVSLDYAPFFSDNEYVANLKNLHKEVHKKTRRVLLTHIGVSGAVMNNGTVIESGINQSLFKDYDLTLIGHYHDAQVISDKIKYIGASLQHNFGERPVKGATVLYDDLSTELVEFEFPKYIAYEINAKELTLKDIEDLKQATKDSGDNLRIVLTGTKAEIESIDKQRLMTAGIDVTTKQDLIEKEEVEQSIVAFTDTSILEAFTEFCKKNKLKESEGLKYLKQAIC
jgi:DNA repair protein SbcD/Mre11